MLPHYCRWRQKCRFLSQSLFPLWGLPHDYRRDARVASTRLSLLPARLGGVWVPCYCSPGDWKPRLSTRPPWYHRRREGSGASLLPGRDGSLDSQCGPHWHSDKVGVNSFITWRSWTLSKCLVKAWKGQKSRLLTWPLLVGVGGTIFPHSVWLE